MTTLFLILVLVVNNPLGVQLLQKYLNLGADLALRRQHELRFQLPHYFSQREMPVAEFENDAPRSFRPNRALGKEHNRRFGGPTPTASRCKLRDARLGKVSHDSPRHVSRQPQSETPPAGASPVRHKRNRARRVAPRECHTCRAGPGWRSPAPTG